MLDALAQTGKPLVVVLINSKPLVLPPAAKQAAAVLDVYKRQALALLFGPLWMDWLLSLIHI